jgi:hypothetical protein
MTEFQTKMLNRLAKCRNGIESTTVLASKLGTSRLAIVSAGRALERSGAVSAFRSDNSQWAALMWAYKFNAPNAPAEQHHTTRAERLD